jgi:hypothetical protein
MRRRPFEGRWFLGALHIEVRERRGGAWIFIGPIKTGPDQKLHAAVVDAHGHAKTAQFDFVHPLTPRGRFLSGWDSCGGTKSGSGEFGRLRRDGPGEAERLTTRGMG